MRSRLDDQDERIGRSGCALGNRDPGALSLTLVYR